MPRLLRSTALFVFPLFAIAAGPRASAQDQTTSANLSGIVTDASGAMIPQATVSLMSKENGVSRTATTDAGGHYSFRLLPPSAYTLKVDAQSFRELRQEGITLVPGQSASVPVTLSVGPATDEVTVSADATLLNTDNANLSSEINAKQVVELPLNLRNVYGLAILNSSVQNTTETQRVAGGGSGGTADQDISFLNFGGGFFGTTAFLLDGIWDTASDWGAVVYVPSVDSVDQFKIQTNSFTAQYGFSSGNVINVTTKSGTNALHGDAYEFFRNDALDANFYFSNFNHIPRPPFTRNQFGGSAGGPLFIPHLYEQREKTFFFGLIERLQQSSPTPFSGTVPTTAFLGGDFSALLGTQLTDSTSAHNPVFDALGRPVLNGSVYDPFSGRQITAGRVDARTGLVATSSGFIRDPFPGNVVPKARFNPTGAAIASFFPAATGPGISNNFNANASAPTTSTEYLIRIDHNLSDKTRLYGRWAQKYESKTNFPAFYGADNPGGPGNVRPNNRYNFTLGASHVFTPTLTASANVGYSRWAEGGVYQGFGFDQTKLGLPASLNIASRQFPLINTSSLIPLGPSQGGEGTGFRNVGSISGDVVKTAGAHNVSFGFLSALLQNNGSSVPQTNFSIDQNFTGGPDPTAVTSQTGYGFASLLLGTAAGGSTSNNFNSAVTKRYYGFYVEDDWKATHTLSLNLGLRYEWQGAPNERYNRQAYFDYNAVNPISASGTTPYPGAIVFNTGSNRGQYGTNYKNFAPRIGFSEQVTNKLVLRGGYGIFFPPAWFGGGYNPGFQQSTSYTSSTDSGVTPFTTLSNPFPSGLLQPRGSALGGLQDVGQGTTAVPFNRKSPYEQNYSLGVQYGFTPNDVLTVSYVGNHGTHLLLGSFNRSQLNPSFYSLGSSLNDQVPNPFFGRISASSCGLDQPTIARGHLLSPYPQYCNVQEPQAPVGFSNYNALQADYNHRFHAGLNVLVSYTYSKFLDNVSGTNNWAITGDSGAQNYYNLAGERSVDGADIPHSLVANYLYEIPVGRGRHFAGKVNRKVDAVIGGFQVSGITSFKSGFPLEINGGGGANLYGANVRPNITGNYRIANPTINQWFNTQAFQPLPSTTYGIGNEPRFLSNLRSPRYQNWDISLQKYWSFTERVRLQGRAEFYNTFNHANFYAPDTNLGDRTNGGFGTIRQSFAPRDVQLAAKLLW